MKSVRLNFWMMLVALVPFFVSCEDGEENIPGIYDNGILVLNEGGYGSANASISFYNPSADSVSNGIFTKSTGLPLGDVGQSLAVIDNHVFIVLNGSNKVEVVNKEDFSSVATIEDITGPRYMVKVAKNKAYLSAWGDNAVFVINTNDFEVTDTIKVGAGPEQIAVSGDYAYIGHSGGYGFESFIAVIKISTNEVVKEIATGDNPASLVVDNSGDLWTLCRGKIVYNYTDWSITEQSASKLMKINTSSNTISKEIQISETAHPNFIQISPDGSTLYYGGGYGFNGIFAVSSDANTVQTEPLINKSFYGFSVNPANGDIYGCEAPSFSAPGTVYRYNSAGTELASQTVGIGPNSVYFID